MVPITMLWMPIVLSAVSLFVASNVLWMALPFWQPRGRASAFAAILGFSFGSWLWPR